VPRPTWISTRKGLPGRNVSPWRPTLVVLWLLMLAYAAFFSAASIRQHDAFLTHKADLGHFDQPIWNTLHGRPFVRTQQGLQLTRLTDHFEPIFVPLSLSFLLWDDVRALLVLQALAVALGALPIFWLTREELQPAGYSRQVSEVAGLIVACVYLLFPALEAANLTEFHAAPLMVAPMLFALYYARRERYGWMWVWALVVMSVKEEMSLLTFMLAMWLLIFRRQWKHGLALAAVSLLWFGVATFVIIPQYAPLKYGIDESVYFQRYGELGDSPLAVARSLLTKPGVVWRIATEPERVQYLLGLLASAAMILPLLAPDVLLLCLPSLLANLLSGYEAMYSGVFHYSAPVVPFVVAAAAVGLGRVGRVARHSRYRDAVVVGAAVLLLAGSVAYHHNWGHTPLARGFRWPEVTEHHRLLERRFAPQVPPGAVLSTTAPLFPHVDHRERIHQFPIVEDATSILLDAASFPEMHPADMRTAYDELITSGSWCIVDAADGYILLERRPSAEHDPSVACARELPDAFYDFARLDEANPQYRVQADFDGQVRLMGYDVTSVEQWHRVGVRLYWTRISSQGGTLAEGEDLQLYPFWLGEGGRIVETPEQRPLVEPAWYPASQWRPGEVVVTEMLPWDIGDEFRLGVAVLDAEDNRLSVTLGDSAQHPAYAMDGSTWLRLAAFRWEDGEVGPVDEDAPLRYPLSVNFGDRIELMGYDLAPARLNPGDRLKLRLQWSRTDDMGRDEAGIDRDLTVFVHLVDAQGERVAQGDGMPGYLGQLPTTLWEPGVSVLDEHVVDLPADVAPGRYGLLLGWYDVQSGERLPSSPGGDSLLLGEVDVQ
jgi:uncharacterized membrane protein